MSPIKVLNDIYYAYPQAALAKDKDQCTPIYVAVEAGFEDTVNFLTSACPKACLIACTRNSTPIQQVIYGFDIKNMLDSIIMAKSESAFIEDHDGDFAFDFYFRLWKVCMRIAASNQNTCDNILDIFTGHRNWKIGDVYKKA